MSDYSIWLDPESNHLFGILTRTDNHTMDQLPDTEIMKRWWKHMADIMETHPDNVPVQVPLKRVFYRHEHGVPDQGPARPYTGSRRRRRGTYFKPGISQHWLVDSLISNPMSGYPKYREKRSSWGIGVLGCAGGRDRDRGRHHRRCHRLGRRAGRLDDPQPFRPLRGW